MSDTLVQLCSSPNTLLLGVFGMALALSRRWSHLRWLSVYVLALFVCSVVYRTILPTSEFSLLKRLVGELLALGVVVEILRKEVGKRPLWPWFALAGLTFVPFLPLHPAMLYYLPQEIFAIGLALELPTALRNKNAPLFAWSMLGTATLLSDTIKLIVPSKVVWQVLIRMDTWLFTGFVVLLLGGLFLPELRALRAFLLSISTRRSGALQGAAHACAPSAGKAHDNVIDFESHPHAINRLRSDLEEIFTRLDALGAAIGMTSLNPVSFEKPFLSREELALYLGTSEDVAERFVETSGIEKRSLTGEPDKWVVRLEDVRDVLMHS